jgi:hypothetical protein
MLSPFPPPYADPCTTVTLSWLLENKRLGLRYDRCGFIIQSLLQAGCIFLVATKLAREL